MGKSGSSIVPEIGKAREVRPEEKPAAALEAQQKKVFNKSGAEPFWIWQKNCKTPATVLL
jgi:hypothetical protein